jgi:hypothetical protein
MSETSGAPMEPNEFRHKEYEDPHYHDEDDVNPVVDDDHHGPRKTGARSKKPQAQRRVIRRRFEE